MNSDVRNRRVLVLLIASLTLGAGLLFWLEPQPDRRGRAAPLAAVNRAGPGIEIEYLPGDYQPQRFHFVYQEDGLYWQNSAPPPGPVRIGLIRSLGGHLREVRAKLLLQKLAELEQTYGVDFNRIALAPGSDARAQPGLPAEVHELTALLVGRGIVR